MLQKSYPLTQSEKPYGALAARWDMALRPTMRFEKRWVEAHRLLYFDHTMLPHFPKAYKEMREIYNSQMFEALFSVSPMLAEIPFRPQREGRDSTYQDESGGIRKIDFKQRSVSMEHKVEEARGMTLREFLESARKPGSEMGHLMMRDVFDMVIKTTEETGNTVDAGGRPFSFDLLIAALDKIELDFDSDGKARFPTLMLNSQVYAEAQRKIPEWDKDPSCLSRLEEVIRRKREEFREREARRRLVD